MCRCSVYVKDALFLVKCVIRDQVSEYLSDNMEVGSSRRSVIGCLPNTLLATALVSSGQQHFSDAHTSFVAS